MLDKSNISPADIETRLTQTWQNLAQDKLGTLDLIYHPEVHFIDPSGEIHGREQLKQHLSALYKNVISCQFTLGPSFGQAPNWAQSWQMELRHPQLAKTRAIQVAGISQLHSQNGLIIYHRDYFDLGAMLYEHIPIIGLATRWLKNRVTS